MVPRVQSGNCHSAEAGEQVQGAGVADRVGEQAGFFAVGTRMLEEQWRPAVGA